MTRMTRHGGHPFLTSFNRGWGGELRPSPGSITVIVSYWIKEGKHAILNLNHYVETKYVNNESLMPLNAFVYKCLTPIRKIIFILILNFTLQSPDAEHHIHLGIQKEIKSQRIGALQGCDVSLRRENCTSVPACFVTTKSCKLKRE